MRDRDVVSFADNQEYPERSISLRKNDDDIQVYDFRSSDDITESQENRRLLKQILIGVALFLLCMAAISEYTKDHRYFHESLDSLTPIVSAVVCGIFLGWEVCKFLRQATSLVMRCWYYFLRRLEKPIPPEES